MEKKHIVFFLLVIALVLAFSGCKTDKGGTDYKVSGRVLTTDGARGVPDAAIAFSGISAAATTDKYGMWSQSGLEGSVTVTPAAPKDGFDWEFQPANKTVSKAATGVNFKVKDLLYYNGFSDPTSGWGSYVDENCSRNYEDNEYEMKVTTPDYRYFVWMTIFPVNYRIQVDVRRYEGEDGFGGIVFNVLTKDDFYYNFRVKPYDQTYGLFRGGDYYEVVVNWKSSAHITQGDGVNRLEVVQNGGKVDLYINGNLVEEDIEIEQHEGETVLGAGMCVGTWEAPVTFRFDDFQAFMEGEVLTTVDGSTISSPIYFRAAETGWVENDGKVINVENVF